MSDAIDAGSVEGGGEVVGSPESSQDQPGEAQTEQQTDVSHETAAETPQDTTTEVPEGGWMWTDGVIGNGEKPDWLLDKYTTVEAQAKAYKDAERRIGEQNQRLGAFTGAPDKYDFSSIEDEGFAFDTQDKTFNQFVTECQNSNVSQDFAVKIAGLAKTMIQEPTANLENEAKTYGASFEADKTNIKHWVSNNNAETDATELLESVKTAGAMRALRNLMNTNGFRVPGSEVPTPPKETIKDLKSEFVENLYSGDNLASNPDKAQKWVEKFNKLTG